MPDRASDIPMSARERAAVRKAVRIASAGARRDRLRRQTAEKIRAGKYVSPEDFKKLQAAGVNFGMHGFVGKTVHNLVEDVEYAPAGLYQIGKAGYGDVHDTLRGRPTLKRTGDVGEKIGESTYASFRHPLRRPGDTLLNLLAGYGAIAGTASRVAAAGQAARAGGTRAALTRAGYEGGSLLRRPTPGPRIHTVGGLPVRGKYSASAGIRAVQRAKDKIMEGESGVGEAATIRRAGRELGQNRRIAVAQARGPAGKLARMGKRLTKPQQMALRLWGKNITVDEQIAKHTRDLAKATSEKSKRNLRHRIALAEAARPYMEGSDLAKSFAVPRKKGGRRGASPKELRNVARQADRVAGKKPGGRERALLEAGLITPEQMDFRINAPGRLDLGAEWITAAEHAVQQLSDIQGERTAILKGAEQVIPARTETISRPRTRAEAEALLGKIDNAVNPLITELANAMRADVPKRGKVQDNFFYFTEMYGKKLGAYLADLPHEDRIREGFGRDIAARGQNARALNFDDLAADMVAQATGAKIDYTYPLDTLMALRETLKESGVDPDALGAAIRKQDELRSALTLDVEEALGGPIAERDFGAVESTRQVPEQRVPGEIGDEGVARLAELDRLEQRAFENLDNEGMALVGAEEHRGRIRVPDVPQRQQRTHFAGAGVYRGGQPKAPPSIRKGYKGALEQSGNYQVNTTRNIAISALEAHKYTNVLELRQKILSAGVKQRPQDTRAIQWVPVREKALTEKQRRQLRESEPIDEHEAALEVAGGEKARVEREASRWAAFLEDIFPEEELSGTPVGAEVKNVVWVPRQLLTNMNKPFARSPFAPAVAVVDTALNLVKFGVIPLKPAYVTANAVGNALFNVFQQGVFLPRNWHMARKLLKDPRTGPALREIMESGGMQALVGGNPKGLGVLNAAMHGYANVLSEAMLEPMMRLSSFYHEAARFGHKTPAQIFRLVTDPAKADELAEIARRGKDAIIDYDRMGPFEKAVMRRALFIYPWVKGATLYGGHFLMEHPVQSGVLGAIGSVGREQAEKDLGETPSWAEGTFKVGGSDEFPLVVNPATISPFSQAAEIAHTVEAAATGEGGSVGQLGGLLHPGIQAAIEAGFKRDQFTGAPLQGSFQDLLLRRSLSQTAPAVLLEGLKKADRPPGRRAYPATKAQVIERALIGSFAPRTANREALNEAARREKEATLTPAQRARRSVFRERQAIVATMKRNDPELLQGGRLPAPVRQAYNRKAEVDAARAAARQKARGDSETYYREVAVSEAKLLERWGAVPKGFAADVAEQVSTLDVDALKQGVQKMRDDLMPDAYRDITSEGAKYLERRG